MPSILELRVVAQDQICQLSNSIDTDLLMLTEYWILWSDANTGAVHRIEVDISTLDAASIVHDINKDIAGNKIGTHFMTLWSELGKQQTRSDMTDYFRAQEIQQAFRVRTFDHARNLLVFGMAAGQCREVYLKFQFEDRRLG